MAIVPFLFVGVQLRLRKEFFFSWLLDIVSRCSWGDYFCKYKTFRGSFTEFAGCVYCFINWRCVREPLRRCYSIYAWKKSFFLTSWILYQVQPRNYYFCRNTNSFFPRRLLWFAAWPATALSIEDVSGSLQLILWNVKAAQSSNVKADYRFITLLVKNTNKQNSEGEVTLPEHKFDISTTH